MQTLEARKTYRNVIFDLGAVLMCWNPTGTLAKLRQLHPVIPVDFLEVVKSETWADLDRGRVTTQGVIDTFSGRFDRQLLIDFITLSFNAFAPIQAGIRMLQAVQERGYKTYILSNLCPEVRDQHYHKHPFFKTFDGAVFSCDIGTIKPEPQIYQHLLDTYALNAEECFFIDDLAANIEAGRACGIDGVVCSDHAVVEKHLQTIGIL